MVFLVLGAATLALLFSGELPKWAVGGSRIAQDAILPPANVDTFHLWKGQTLIFVGDSHVLGSRSAHPRNRFERSFPGLLQNALKLENSVHVFGAGGFTAEMGLHKWGQKAKGDIIVVLFGSNDAAPRGFLSRSRPVPVDRYKIALRSIIRRQREAGGRTLVLAPPPAAARAMTRRLAPYRRAAREIAVAEGAAFLDPAEALASCKAGVLFEYDGTHINQAGQSCIAVWLKGYLQPQQ